MSGRLLRNTIALALACATWSATAHTQSGDDAVDFCQGAYPIMGWHMGLLAEIARGEKPFDAAAVKHWAGHLQWAERLPAQTDTLVQAASGDDTDAIRSAIGKVGEACHDRYRKDMPH